MFPLIQWQGMLVSQIYFLPVCLSFVSLRRDLVMHFCKYRSFIWYFFLFFGFGCLSYNFLWHFFFWGGCMSLVYPEFETFCPVIINYKPWSSYLIVFSFFILSRLLSLLIVWFTSHYQTHNGNLYTKLPLLPLSLSMELNYWQHTLEYQFSYQSSHYHFSSLNNTNTQDISVLLLWLITLYIVFPLVHISVRSYHQCHLFSGTHLWLRAKYSHFRDVHLLALLPWLVLFIWCISIIFFSFYQCHPCTGTHLWLRAKYSHFRGVRLLVFLSWLVL